jgi:hypothetical protein
MLVELAETYVDSPKGQPPVPDSTARRPVPLWVVVPLRAKRGNRAPAREVPRSASLSVRPEPLLAPTVRRRTRWADAHAGRQEDSMDGIKFKSAVEAAFAAAAMLAAPAAVAFAAAPSADAAAGTSAPVTTASQMARLAHGTACAPGAHVIARGARITADGTYLMSSRHGGYALIQVTLGPAASGTTRMTTSSSHGCASHSWKPGADTGISRRRRPPLVISADLLRHQ